MLKPYMWLVPFFIAAIIVFTASYFSASQNTLTNTVKEVETMLQSSSIGSIRTKQNNVVDPNEVVSNLIAEIVEKQKNHGQNIKIDYAFIDSNNNVVSEISNDIKSIQFRVTLFDDNGKKKAQAEKRLSLNKKAGW